MKKKNVRIKKNITFKDQLNAIEYIVSCGFKIDNNGEIDYTPEYVMPGEVEAYALFFLDGLEFDKDEIKYVSIMKDTKVMSLIMKFFSTNEEDSQYASIRNYVINNAYRKIDFRSQVIIHGNPVYNQISEFLEKINYAFEAFEAFDSLINNVSQIETESDQDGKTI